MMTERIRGLLEAARIADEMDKSGASARHVASALRRIAAERDSAPAEPPKTESLGHVPTTCIEHAYGSTYRTTRQIKVF